MAGPLRRERCRPVRQGCRIDYQGGSPRSGSGGNVEAQLRAIASLETSERFLGRLGFDRPNHLNQSTKLPVVAVAFPAVHKLTNNLEIIHLIMTIAVDPVERAKPLPARDRPANFGMMKL